MGAVAEELGVSQKAGDIQGEWRPPNTEHQGSHNGTFCSPQMSEGRLWEVDVVPPARVKYRYKDESMNDGIALLNKRIETQGRRVMQPEQQFGTGVVNVLREMLQNTAPSKRSINEFRKLKSSHGKKTQ